ncbi:metallophosphoesterase family protein [Nannocystis sp. SCPEA4]|uniref:metallophosphoesterase family protein n=1 Tax=Nannocystis sp. SCPEA4 TaxID=2996787 RepID=UPI00226D4496|nr:metallophosphoesterase family protein [Nannocystis sp. SCPEA4]
MPRGPATLGVLSDTHGLVRPEALAALAGVAHIVHAGDVGGPEVFAALAAVAPVTAVRGNNDRDKWGRALPATATLEFAGRRIHVLHDAADLAVDPRAAKIDVVITGHSHKPKQVREGGVLYLNPGSAGPRRFKLPITLARVRVRGDELDVEFVELVAV